MFYHTDCKDMVSTPRVRHLYAAWAYVLLYKTLHGLAPPCLQDFIKHRQTRVTRAVVNKDVEIPFRKTSFSQNALSTKGGILWNSIPLHIRECPSLATFKMEYKKWLRAQQTCSHWWSEPLHSVHAHTHTHTHITHGPIFWDLFLFSFPFIYMHAFCFCSGFYFFCY